MVDPMDMMPKEKKEEPRHKGGGFFSSGQKESPFDISVISNEVANLSRSVRTLEERTANLLRKSQLEEQNMLSSNKKVSGEMKSITDNIHELKKELGEINDHMHQIVEELKRCSKKEEIRVLQKYIDMWEPVNFVTRNEVEKIMTEILEQKGIK